MTQGQNLSGRAQRRLLLILAGASVFIVCWGLGSLPLLSLNEARRAVPVSGMFNTGNWLLPYLNGQLYIDKPPVFYWAALLVSSIAGVVNEWTLRFPSALAALLVMGCSWRVVHRTLGSGYAIGVLLVLANCTNFLLFARRGEIEMLLTALCTGSLLFAHDYILRSGPRRSIWLSHLLMGLAVLCKGPVALLFVHLPVLLMSFRQMRAREFISSAVGWLILFGVGLSWYALVTAQLGFDVWQAVISTDISGKVSGKSGRDPVYTYLMFVIGDFLPWSLLLIAQPRVAWRSWQADPGLRFFLLAAVVPLVVLSLFGNKHAKYLLPAYPAIAILTGYRLIQWMQQLRDARIRLLCVVVGAVMVIGYGVFFAVLEARVFQYRYAALQQMPALVRSFPGVTLASYKDVDMRTVYYLGQAVRIVEAQALRPLANDPEPVLLLVEEEKQRALVQQNGWQIVREMSPYLSRDEQAAWMANRAFMQQFPAAARSGTPAGLSSQH